MQQWKKDRRFAPSGVAYDRAAKRCVRAHLVPFFSQGAPLAEPYPRVWCFPGSSSDEVRQYRTAGIPMDHLRAFEWDPAVVPRIRKRWPSLPLHAGSLGTFLESHAAADAQCDWANLDFDGSALTFREEVCAVVARMDMCNAPRLGLTSFAARNRDVLVDAVVAMSAMRTIAPAAFAVGLDLAVEANGRYGAIRDPDAVLTTIAREFAAYLLVLRAFGGAAYSTADAADARAFRLEFDAALDDLRRALAKDVTAYLRQRTAFPFAESAPIAHAVSARIIPVWPTEWLRFAYRSERGNGIWTWLFRFEPAPGVSLRAWATKFLTMVPPLHCVGRSGRLLRGIITVCPWCPDPGGHR
ncbi:hypothetical protein HY480_03245 [Candidatus Uhrbacteria bacterium]|nr:hypothetical protein [Candidatus Uhrbacteria bacterium]